MERNVRRIIMLGAVLALIGMLVISTGALAKGPDGAAQTQTQTRSQAQAQVQLGSQAARNGEGYGPGDGTGPIGGGQFGPGPYGKCLDEDGNGICDCRE